MELGTSNLVHRLTIARMTAPERGVVISHGQMTHLIFDATAISGIAETTAVKFCA